MKTTTMVISPQNAELLAKEVVSDEARLRLTRLLRYWSRSRGDADVALVFVNRVVNIARAPLGLPVYVLDSGGDDVYAPVEHAWHQGELELAMRRPSTAKLAEILVDLATDRLLDVAEINEILKEDGVSFRLVSRTSAADDDLAVTLAVASDQEIEAAQVDGAHPNIRGLITRMELLLASEDWAGVLHTCASVFETLAKVVVNLATVENQTLGGFFDGYRKRSNLPGPLLDYILGVYQRRNVEPTAGHGGTSPPSVTKAEAVVLAELTRAAVRMERTLSEQDSTRGGRAPLSSHGSPATRPTQATAPSATAPSLGKTNP